MKEILKFSKLVLLFFFLPPILLFSAQEYKCSPSLLEKFVYQLNNKTFWTLYFFQTNYFVGEYDYYSGRLLKKSPSHYIVIYDTAPPFIVDYQKNIITVGYKNQEKERFNINEYPNPLLRVLFNIDKLDKFFRIDYKGNCFYILYPKETSLQQVVNYVKVYLSPSGLLKRIEIFSSEDNKVILDIESIQF
jgi:hypothetical protein